MLSVSLCLWTTGIRVGRARFDPQNPAWKDPAILKILRDKVKAKIGRQLCISYGTYLLKKQKQYLKLVIYGK
jgi:hypothetical protein